MMAALVDQHVTALRSEHPVDVESNNFHNVRPWFQGKLPFTFNMPEVQDSSFTLIGGKVVYAGQNPGAELLYQVRQHKISIFVFQAKTTGGAPDEAGKLAAMFQEVNRS